MLIAAQLTDAVMKELRRQGVCTLTATGDGESSTSRLAAWRSSIGATRGRLRDNSCFSRFKGFKILNRKDELAV